VAIEMLYPDLIEGEFMNGCIALRKDVYYYVSREE